MIPTITYRFLLTLPLIQQVSRCTSKAISTIPLNSVSFPMVPAFQRYYLLQLGFLKSHPDIVIEKKLNSPDEDKDLADAKALIPALRDFFKKHSLINPIHLWKKAIHHFKESFCVVRQHTHKLHQHKYIRSLKPLIP